jgi:CheY-like chemotaxis protein
MGGTIVAHSRVGDGSTFEVELSVAEAPTEKAPAPGEEPDQTPPSSARAASVLYVEDNLANVRLMERIVSRRPGVTLLVAIQGSLALELAREHRPNLILLDLNLPDMPGVEVLRRLRADPLTATTPVVVISGDAMPGQAERVRALGANDFVSKPFNLSRLLAVIDEAGLAQEDNAPNG